MSDTIVWIIIIAFYAPLHYLGPIMVALLTGAESSDARRREIRLILIDCTLSMVITFTIILVLVSDHILPAMLIMLVSLFTPYIHLWWDRRQRGTAWADTNAQS